MDERKFIAMTARMDGGRSIAARIGRKKYVSEMELIALCNFARIGLMSVFSELDGEAGTAAAMERELLKNAIQRQFSGETGLDGLNMLAECCTAILAGERFGKYIVERE